MSPGRWKDLPHLQELKGVGRERVVERDWQMDRHTERSDTQLYHDGTPSNKDKFAATTTSRLCFLGPS